MKKIIEQLKLKDVKATAQRIAIIEFLQKNRVHPTAEDIYLAVKKQFPTISLATIYNTLEKLEELGELIKLKVNKNNKIHYEYNLEPHSHFYCKECGKIYDIWDNKNNEPQSVDGHKIELTQTFYEGVCKNCLKNKINKLNKGE